MHPVRPWAIRLAHRSCDFHITSTKALERVDMRSVGEFATWTSDWGSSVYFFINGNDKVMRARRVCVFPARSLQRNGAPT